MCRLLATPWRAPAWKPAQPASSEQGDGSAAATRGSTRAASRHTVARASVEASAARVERAGRRLSCRHPRQHTCRLSPHRGARQRRSQRSPHRASRATAQLPPPEAAHVPPLATPWRAPAWKPAQPASSEQGDGSAAATRGSTRAASRHTVARASVEASAARVERAGRRLSCRHPRQHTCRLSPHRGARQRRSQRSPRRASRATAQLPPPKAAHVPPLATPWRAPA